MFMNKKQSNILNKILTLATSQQFETILGDGLVSIYRVESKCFGLYKTTVLICFIDYSETHNMLIINFNKHTKSHEVSIITDIMQKIGEMYNCEIITQNA